MKRPESRAQSQLVVALPAIPLALLLQLRECPPKKQQRLAMLDPFVRLRVTRKELQAPDRQRCRRGGSRSTHGLKGWVRAASSRGGTPTRGRRDAKLWRAERDSRPGWRNHPRNSKYPTRRWWLGQIRWMPNWTFRSRRFSSLAVAWAADS